MLTKIENVTYSYSGGVLSLSGTCTLYDDTGSTMLHQRGISARCNVADPNLKNRLVSSLTAAAQDVKDTYLAVMTTVGQFYPDVASPSEAIAHIVTDVEGGIV